VNYKAVIEASYAYLALLRASPPEPWNFDEFRDIHETEFQFQEKCPAESYTPYAASLLSNPWPKERALSGDYRLWKPDLGLLTKILKNDLVPEKSCIRLSGMDFSLLGLDGPWLKEKWYGTEYMVHKIDQELLSKVCQFSH
jgi:insulysin